MRNRIYTVAGFSEHTGWEEDVEGNRWDQVGEGQRKRELESVVGHLWTKVET